MKVKLITIILLLWVQFANASDRLTPWAYFTIAGDYWQTRQSLFLTDIHEQNSILTSHPSMKRVNLFFLAQGIGTYLIHGTQYQDGWNITMISAHGSAIVNNILVVNFHMRFY
jgi:hypothetical protein